MHTLRILFSLTILASLSSQLAAQRKRTRICILHGVVGWFEDVWTFAVSFGGGLSCQRKLEVLVVRSFGVRRFDVVSEVG